MTARRAQTVLLTFDASHTYTKLHRRKQGAARRFHHSSMVAGAPVAAAGQMVVHKGRLLKVSNESGHFAPPPSCLTPLLARMSEMGVASLHAVRIEPVLTPITQSSPPLTGELGRPGSWGVARPLSADERSTRPIKSPVARRRRSAEVTGASS